MTQTIIINNKTIQLNSSQLIQAGGEGMVFKVGQTAVKLYHNPKPVHQQKLDFFFNAINQLPPELLAPQSAVTDHQGNLIGFQMPLLPVNAVPIKSLSRGPFWKKHSYTTTAVLTLFLQLHTTLTTLHNQGIIIGDLNDQNIFITSTPCHSFDTAQDKSATAQHSHFLIDVDSYQFGYFPCSVAMDLFIDPNLYGIPDLSERPFFSPATDWYAYFVLLVRSMLHIHPYGGVHTQHKSIAARATAGLSILQPNITYPASARPRESLPDDLLNHLHRIFDLGERFPFPVALLNDYANNITTCSQCQQEYPQERPFCPFCTTKQTVPSTLLPTTQPSQLYTTSSFIDSIHALPNGRFLAIIFEQEQYKLLRFGLGGALDEMVLFNGSPGYQFAAFQNTLVVNPPRGKHLLLLDISGNQPRKLAMLETATFRETAVFATSPYHLYRIAGNWIMRGSMQNGHFVEEAIATAHKNQTWFQASPTSEAIAGYHRVFAENRFFLWHQGQNYEIPITPLKPGESLLETAVAFKPHAVIFMLKINQRTTTETRTYSFTFDGQSIRQPTIELSSLPTLQLRQGSINHSATEIWYHPNQ